MKKTVIRGVTLFMYLLTFGVAFPATPVCSCQGGNCARGTEVEQENSRAGARHSCCTPDNVHSGSTGAGCQKVSRACSGNDACEGGMLEAACRRPLHTQSGGDHVGESKTHPKRINEVTVTVDAVRPDTITPRSVRMNTFRDAVPGGNLVHRCLILII